jgi:poly [ADP-ribose] polymerase
MEGLSNRYFTTIPHVFGRNRPPMLNIGAQIKKDIELLETLTEMDIANDIMKKSKDGEEVNELDCQFLGLGLQEMTQRKSFLLLPSGQKN